MVCVCVCARVRVKLLRSQASLLHHGLVPHIKPAARKTANEQHLALSDVRSYLTGSLIQRGEGTAVQLFPPDVWERYTGTSSGRLVGSEVNSAAVRNIW